eukprot:scaffold68_cov340-Pavlova_lutheri.AAC.39
MKRAVPMPYPTCAFVPSIRTVETCLDCMGLAVTWMWNYVPWELRADTSFGGLTSLASDCQIFFLRIVHAFKKVSDELGLDLGKVTHMREFGARFFETLPYINEEDITRLGKWLDGGDGAKVSSVVRTNYFTNVAHKAMVAAGGHSDYTNVCMPCQQEQPHPELLRKIFPTLLFLRTLELARVVFLQDCALLRSTQGSSNAVFGHPVFKCPYWPRFKSKIVRAQSSGGMRSHDTLNQSFMHMFTQHSVAVDHKLKALNEEVRECKSMIAELSKNSLGKALEGTRRMVAHAVKPPPHAPTNCKQFSSLHDLW